MNNSSFKKLLHFPTNVVLELIHLTIKSENYKVIPSPPLSFISLINQTVTIPP